MTNKKPQAAQTAIELAVFGSILIFVLGVTIRSAMLRGAQQQSTLRGMRLAMTLSHQTSEPKNNASRNSASVLIIEDRLTAASGKYGAVDRTPFLAQGSATHSVNLFMPVDYGDVGDLPLSDLFINGHHFTLRMSGFRSFEMAAACSAVGGACSTPKQVADCDGDCTASSLEYYRGADVPLDLNPIPYDHYWEPNCVQLQVSDDCRGLAPAACVAAGCINCSGTSFERYIRTATVGCARMYKIMDNHPKFQSTGAPENGWCDNELASGAGVGPLAAECQVAPCLTTPAKGCNLRLQDRFDLDQQDWDGDTLDVVVVDQLQREGFAWQWYQVLGYDEGWRAPESLGFSLGDEDWLPGVVIAPVWLQGEGLIMEDADCSDQCKDPQNTTLDLDYDLKLEAVARNTENNRQGKVVFPSGVIQRLGVRDGQLGDIDTSYNDSDEALGIPAPGFTKNVRIYTQLRGETSPDGGTYYQIDEGQLFTGMGDTRQFVRAASKKDQIDIVERTFQLSNNTGRLCSTGSPSVPVDPEIEVCGNNALECFWVGNRDRTCLDVPNMLLYIRSRVADLHGRKWVTETGSDPYIDFTID